MIERWVFRCPYCGREIESEPIALCCGELHGEWSLEESQSESPVREKLKIQPQETEELDVRSVGSNESVDQTKE